MLWLAVNMINGALIIYPIQSPAFINIAAIYLATVISYSIGYLQWCSEAMFKECLIISFIVEQLCIVYLLYNII